MAEADSFSIIQKLATSVGTSEAALKILISILFGEFNIIVWRIYSYMSSIQYLAFDYLITYI